MTINDLVYSWDKNTQGSNYKFSIQEHRGNFRRLLTIRGEKSQISRYFQRQIRGENGRFRGYFRRKFRRKAKKKDSRKKKILEGYQIQGKKENTKVHPTQF